MDIQSWLKQVTTIHGFMAIGGTLVAAGGAYAEGQHQLALVTLATGLTTGVIGLVMPDNTKLSSDASAAVKSFVADAQAKNQAAALADAFAGAVAVLNDIKEKLPPPPPSTPPTPTA